MWTNENRARYDRSELSYSSDGPLINQSPHFWTLPESGARFPGMGSSERGERLPLLITVCRCSRPSAFNETTYFLTMLCFAATEETRANGGHHRINKATHRR
jgi:hypothetical protein